MPEPIKYICSCCGKEHEEWPFLTYASPTSYHNLTAKEKEEIAELDGDFCVIRDTDQTDRFIRGTLTQKVIDHCEDLKYGVWVSLSEKSYNDYEAHIDDENYEAGYFGWLSNSIPGYTFDKHIPTNVTIMPRTQRPEIVPHDDFDHPFVHDYYNGITKAGAERRIRDMIEKTSSND